MNHPVHPARPGGAAPRGPSRPAGPPSRSPLRRYLETRGLVGGHGGAHVRVGLEAADGTRLSAVYLPGPAASAPAVVLLHGFAAHGRKPSYARLADHLSDVAHVLALDLRGHGRSSGITTLGDRETLDAAAAITWLRHAGHGWVALVGASMGGTTALHTAAASGGVEAVVAISAPATFRARAETEPMRRLQAVWESPAGRAGLRWGLGVRVVPPRRWQSPPHPRELAARIEVPLLVVHGVDDAYFPPSDAHQLAAAAPRSELWLEPAGFGHAEDGFMPDFCRRLGGALGHAFRHDVFPPAEASS
jgi:uncharacterized protein